MRGSSRPVALASSMAHAQVHRISTYPRSRSRIAAGFVRPISDWFFLSSTIEAKAFPVFKRNYEILCDRVLQGEELNTPVPVAIPETINQPLTNEERKQRLHALREELNI